MKVFLGGTCNGTVWRDKLISRLNELSVDYFNPVVNNWTEECQLEETRQKESICGTHLYYITSAMSGVFSIAEAVDSAHCEKDTIFVINPEGFDEHQLKSLKAVGKLIEQIGGSYQIDDGSMDGIVEILTYLKEDDQMNE